MIVILKFWDLSIPSRFFLEINLLQAGGERVEFLFFISKGR